MPKSIVLDESAIDGSSYLQSQDERRAGAFLKLFSRMEFALKEAGFYKGAPALDVQAADADWVTFAPELADIVRNRTGALKVSIDHFFVDPPRKQRIVGGKTAYPDKVPSTTPNAPELVKHLKWARNNLFHGGKFYGEWTPLERDRAFIYHGVIILQELMKHEKLQQFMG